MEPGHEDREYVATPEQAARHIAASMEPGHEDREYAAAAAWPVDSSCLNGARS